MEPCGGVQLASWTWDATEARGLPIDDSPSQLWPLLRATGAKAETRRPPGADAGRACGKNGALNVREVCHESDQNDGCASEATVPAVQVEAELHGTAAVRR
eukprot:TRINITY_DN1423_c1_g2_i3.p4 TRINITY_DN1423_c1_g2~~TRINITY_DN1423_c1_g2_i3.p4  ORF type:complete len:101 (+),score=12.11 TRINITY_DN1423_c1_g2_i3:374-676(+)